jgi:hypothetical protein
MASGRRLAYAPHVAFSAIGSVMASNGTGWSDIQKWTMGILAALLTAVVSAWAVNRLGPDKPEEPPSPAKAVVSIVEFDLPTLIFEYSDQKATFTIANEGNAVARRCQLEGYGFFSFDEFSIQPKDKTTIDRDIFAYGLKRGSYKFSATVRCENASSAPVTRVASYFPSTTTTRLPG